MKCGKYHAYESGRMTAEALADHCRECPDCAARAALDARLDAEIRALRKPVAGGPALWNRIEASLEEEKARHVFTEAGREPSRREHLLPRAAGGDGRGAAFVRWLRDRRLLIPAGAVAFGLLACAVLLLVRFVKPPSGILAARALSKVESREKEYLAAIGDLEKMARPKLEGMDLQMVSLYRDKLAAIDAQIEKCREALASNPANAHIRRYLLAALQDKRQTLADVLGPDNAPSKERRNS